MASNERGSRELPDDLKQEIEDDPYYFIYQGGSDGTFAHAEYMGLYQKWEPEISKYAAKLITDRQRRIVVK